MFQIIAETPNRKYYDVKPSNYSPVPSMHYSDGEGMSFAPVVPGHPSVSVTGCGAGFIAWWILQHVRGYLPFATVVQVTRRDVFFGKNAYFDY